MKKITFLFLICSISLFSQKSQLERVDDIVKNYHNFENIEDLAKKIDSDFSTPLEKVRAAYAWTAKNISYSYKNPFQVGNAQIYIVMDDQDYKRRLKREDEKITDITFNNRKGLCKGYALVFQKICRLLHIENKIILGYVKNSSYQIGFVPGKKNHAWNAVKVNGEWYFSDVTAAAGYMVKGVWQRKFSNSFFNIPENIISNTYYSQDILWKSNINQRNLEEFSNLPLFSQAYFDKTFEILSPMVGKINSQKRKKIQLEVIGIDFQTKVYYQYDNGPVKEGDTFFENAIAKIHMKAPSKDATLKIFFDKKEALNYQVVVID